jgi:hypothetical protein
MISLRRIGCDAPLFDKGVRKNAIAALKKKPFDFYTNSFSKVRVLIAGRNRFPRRKNPIPALKKKQSTFNRHSFWKARASVGRQDRFAGQKNPSNKGDTRLLPKVRNRRRNGYTVTTNHLLLPSRRGKAAFLLPISQPNFDLLGSKGNETGTGGRGVSRSDPTKILYR